MSEKSKIQWTNATLNVVVGCTQVSPGCDNCYAKRLVDTRQSKNYKSARFGKPFEELTFHPDRLRMLGVKKPTLFFVNSMSDMFHRDIPDQFIADAFNAFWRHPQHTFQILTKRPERMRRLVNRIWTGEFRPHPGDKPLYVPQNIWLGVSIESSDYAWRADMLRETPAAVRFLSLEPLLGPIAPEVIHGMDWVIVGGESGPGHRPMDLEWARELRAYAGGGAGIPFFFKQVSAQRPTDDMIPADLRIREWPQVAT